MNRRPGAKFVASLPRGRRVVAMTVHRDVLYVASDRRVYRLSGNRLKPLSFGYVK